MRKERKRLTDAERAKILELRDAGKTRVEIAEATGRSTSAIDKVLSLAKETKRPPATGRVKQRDYGRVMDVLTGTAFVVRHPDLCRKILETLDGR